MRRVLLVPAWGHPAGTWLDHPADVWARWASQAGAPLPTLALSEAEAAKVVLAATQPAPVGASDRRTGRPR